MVGQRGDWQAGVELYSLGNSLFQATGDRAFEARLLHAPFGPVAPADVQRNAAVVAAYLGGELM